MSSRIAKMAAMFGGSKRGATHNSEKPIRTLTLDNSTQRPQPTQDAPKSAQVEETPKPDANKPETDNTNTTTVTATTTPSRSDPHRPSVVTRADASLDSQIEAMVQVQEEQLDQPTTPTTPTTPTLDEA